MARRRGTEGSGIRLRRAYELPDRDDASASSRTACGRARRQAADQAIDAWHKDVAPSDALRRWFGHDPSRWKEFVKRHRRELRDAPATQIVNELARRAAAGTFTLVYGSRDAKHNNAVVIRDAIQGVSVPLSGVAVATPRRRAARGGRRAGAR